MTENSPEGRETQWQTEKLLVTSNFSFSRSVVKGLALQTCKNKSLFGKELNKPHHEDKATTKQQQQHILIFFNILFCVLAVI